MRGLGAGAVLTVRAIGVEATMNAGEHFVGFVDQAEIEGRRLGQPLGAAPAARILPAGKEHAWPVDVGSRGFLRLDGEQVEEFLLPLPEQRSRQHDEDARCAFG